MKNRTLAASLALNAMLGATAIAALLSHGSDQQSSSKHPPPLHGGLESGDSPHTIKPGEVYAGLRALGLSDDSARRALVGILQSERGPAAAEYWRGSHVNQIQDRLDKYQTDASVRAIVLDAFGPTATEAPGFEAVFRPLQREFPTLSSSQQLAILEVERSLDQKWLAQSGQTAAGILTPTIDDARDRLAAVLNHEQLFEYDLRRSMLAQRLAASGFAFTEREFRDVFAIYSADGNAASRRQQRAAAALQPKLREALGPERYELFARSQDPAFRVLVSVARAHGLSQEKVEAAYRIVSMTTHELGDINQKSASGLRKNDISKAGMRSDEELRNLLGKAAYEQFSSSAATFRMRPTMIASPAIH